MSGLGAGHVREMPLESGIGAEYDWLNREKTERSDMSDLGAGYVWSGGRTSPSRVSGIWLGGRTSSWIGPTGLTGVQYRSDQCDRF
jgi:hypothetical protein